MQQEFERFSNLFAELRKESLEANRMRSQTIGFKITFVSTAMGLIIGNLDKAFDINNSLIVRNSFLLAFFIPAYAAVFFDLLIISYGITISRLGLYCRKYIEKNTVKPTKQFKFWEEFMDSHRVRQKLAIIANSGITALAIAITAIVTYNHFMSDFRVIFLFAALILFYVYALAAFTVPGKIVYEKYDWLRNLFIARPRLASIKKEYLEGNNKCRVTFELLSEKLKAAKKIQIVGDFNNWDTNVTPMKKVRKGKFEVTIELECYKEYQFRYLIDDKIWENHWNADRYEWNSLGSENSVVEV